MFKKSLPLLLLTLTFVTAPVRSQESQSLGDIARRVRADRDKASAPATPSTTPNAGGAASSAVPSAKLHPAVADKQQAAAGQYAPYATREEFDLHRLDRYQEGIRALFQQEKFEVLDKTADAARTTKARLPGGSWAIHLIYLALMTPAEGTYDASEKDWTSQLVRLQRWTAQRPDSITARVALAGAQLQFAWRARGGGYANKVTDDGWRVFQQRVEMAAKTLMDVSSLPAKCPEWFLTLQLTARALGQSKEMQTAIYEKAIAFEPDYQYFYRAQAEMLMPKWEGEEGEMAAFAAHVADRIGGKKGDIIYFQIAAVLICGCDNDRGLNGLSWPRIKRGYTDLEEQYGEFVGNLNGMAYMAGMVGDIALAHEMFARIGEGWDEVLWHTKENFHMVRQWAQFAEMPKPIDAAMKAADDNLQTSDGRKFDEQVAKTFASNYSATVSECLKSSGDLSLVPFDMVLQVGGNGTVEQIVVSKMSRTSSCIAAKLDGGLFPPPPKPDYWVKISMQVRR
jgi:hypothetical protein